MLVKMYEGDSSKSAPAERRHSPAVCTGARELRITGNPDPAHISTSFVERQNLTMRMSMRRFTRLTNAFSKKVDNHKAAVALHFMHYNFARGDPGDGGRRQRPRLVNRGNRRVARNRGPIKLTHYPAVGSWRGRQVRPSTLDTGGPACRATRPTPRGAVPE
jgi:hypothetical protein